LLALAGDRVMRGGLFRVVAAPSPIEFGLPPRGPRRILVERVQLGTQIRQLLGREALGMLEHGLTAAVIGSSTYRASRGNGIYRRLRQ